METMRKLLAILGVWMVMAALPVSAVVDPLAVPNNKVGVHILEPSELPEAAKLVNSNGGDWGYVTIPIRADDRDREKWIKFFQDCRNLHLIPIVRLATYADKDKWVAPAWSDLADWANFLSEMPWPVKNRYIIIYNEPNHSKEWGGQVSPVQYATLLFDAQTIFKAHSQDYYLLFTGLDMSAPTNRTSLDALSYYRAMTLVQPDWYKKIDGLAMHAYPNPAFKASVYSKSRYGVTSYRYEQELLKSLGFASKPIFITETGTLSQGEFYTPAFTQIWTDNNIVAITPFILFAGSGEFAGFSLLDTNRQPTKAYRDILSLPKVAGSPLLENPVLTNLRINTAYSAPASPQTKSKSLWSRFLSIFNRDKKQLNIGPVTTDVEIVDTPASISQGLSGREKLKDKQVMLFSFPDTQPRIFWMKDMKFALDFIWVKNGVVVGLTKNVPPPAENNGITEVVPSPSEVNQVVEVNAGFIDKYGIREGDSVVLNSQ